MKKAGFVALATLALMSAGCSTYAQSFYPRPDRSLSTYESVRQLRADRMFDAGPSIARLTPVAGEAPTRLAAISSTVTATAISAPGAEIAAFEVSAAPAASTPAASSVASAEPDAPGRFVCADGSTLDVSYTLDRRTAVVRIDDAATPVELTRTEDRGLPTYVRDGVTMRSMGPRVSWSTAEGETTVTVQAGDTLSAIALRRFGSFDAVDSIVSANRGAIADADLIYPGQVLVLPGAAEQSCRKLVSAERA